MGDMMKYSAAQANMINSILTGAWDLSAFVLAGISAAYFYLGWNPLYFSLELCAVTIPFVALFVWKIYPPSSEGPSKKKNKKKTKKKTVLTLVL